MTTQWDGVEEFLAVAESGNFTAAAGRLGVSVSLVSRRVSQLEQRLGAKLFKRTIRRVNLTTSGESYLLSCNQLVAGFNQAKEADRPEPGREATLGAQVERRTDLYLSTLRRFVEAAGGKLELRIELPGTGAFTLTGVGEIDAHTA